MFDPKTLFLYLHTPRLLQFSLLRIRPCILCLVHSATIIMAVKAERPPSYSSAAPQPAGESAPIYQDSEGFFTTRKGVSFMKPCEE